MDAESKKALVGDIGIAYKRIGGGIPLVTLHGGPGIGHHYLRPLDAWSDEFQIVYFDQRGSGDTELGDPERVTFTGAMADLDGLRRHLGIGRVSLVGHSFGAILGLLFAAKKPELVQSLVLLNPAPPFIPNLAEQLWANMAAQRTPEDDAEKEALESSDGFARHDPGVVERHMLNVYTPFFSDRERRDRAKLGFTSITTAHVGAAWNRMYRDLEALDPIGSLAEVRCPTLIVHSERDPVPEEFSRLLADKIAAAEYQFIGNASHFVHYEDPAALAAVVKPFLRSFAVDGLDVRQPS